MEIGQQGESVEDSILKNLSETRDLWRSQESNQNTKMLQPKSKVSNHSQSWSMIHGPWITKPIPRSWPDGVADTFRIAYSKFHKYLVFRI